MILEFIVGGYALAAAISWRAKTDRIIREKELYQWEAFREYYRILWHDLKSWAWD